jgi:fucose permease
MKLTYKTTMVACFVGYIVQAIVVNFAPLLFVTFQNTYAVSFSRITLLVAVNFCVQFLVDLLSAGFVDKIGYRTSIVMAQFLCAMGLVLLTVLPGVMDPFAGILLAMVVYAVGGGIIEVLISPIMESCPTDNKEKAMSLLHSFYCWGHVAVVLISTGFFAMFGIANWRILTCLWAIIPIVNGFFFLKVPIAPLMAPGEKGMTLSELFKSKVFWGFIVMMVCAGASEQAVSQWASAFAEKGLGISKTLGDLTGTLTFALCMGSSRWIYGRFGDRIDIHRFMTGSTMLCVVAYLLIALSPWPALNLVGCALCGFSVGIMWPGTFSKAAVALRTGGTAMFALLALAGDLGCTCGPTLAGAVSGIFGDNLKAGILTAVVFPVVMLLLLIKKKKARVS